MANVKVSAIAENTNPDLNDLLYVVTSDGSLTSNKSTIQNVLKNATNIIRVGTSEAELRTAILNANNGDAIMLPSGIINIGSGFVINKQLKIIGQGQVATIINATSPLTFFYVTTDGFVVNGIKLTRTNTDNGTGYGVRVVAPSNQSFDGENTFISNLWMTWTNGTVGVAAGVGGICFENAGGNILNSLIQLSAVSPDSTDQTIGIFHKVDSNNTLDTTCRVFDTRVEVTHGPGDGGSQELARGFMAWNNAGLSPFKSVNYLQNVVLIVRAATNTQTEAFQNQGYNVNTKVFNSYIDGGYDSNPLHYDIRITKQGSSAPVVELYNTVLANNKIEDNADNTLYRYGIFQGQGFSIDSASKPNSRSTPTAPDKNPGGLTLVGGDGADNIVSTSGSGGTGSLFTIKLGNGGQADLANTTAVGGQGGYFNAILGNGASVTVTSGTNVGGPGGYYVIQAGQGGNASGGVTRNVGGIGGTIMLIPGSGGSGTTAVGSDGNIYFGTDTKGTRIGRIFLGTSQGLASGSGLCLRNTDLQLSAISSGSTASSGYNSTIVDSCNILRVGGFGGSFTLTRTPNIDASYDSKMLYIVGDNTLNTLTLQDEVFLPGSKLNLGGYNLSMNSGQVVHLMYNKWSGKYEKIGDSFKKNFTIQTVTLNSGNVTTGEDDLLLYNLSSGIIDRVNQSLDYKCWGIVGSNGTGKRIKFYFGSQVILDTNVITENSSAWVFNSTIVRSDNNVQKVISEFYTSSTSFISYVIATENLSSVVQLKVTGSSMTSSSNDVIQTGHRIHFYNTNG